MNPNQRKILLFAVLGLAGLLVFMNALPNPYYYDDLPLLRDNEWIRLGPGPGLWFSTGYFDSHEALSGFRPFLMLSFWVNSHLMGHTPEAFRIVNLSLHILNAALLVVIFLRLTRCGWTDPIAWGAGFLFLLHPSQTLPINFLWKRSTLLETTILFSSILLHIEICRRQGYRVWSLMLQFTLLGLALFTKESAVLLPLFWWIAVLPERKTRAHTGSLPLAYLYGIGALLTMGFAGFRIWVFESFMGLQIQPLPTQHQISATTYWLNSVANFPTYLKLWMIPSPHLLDAPSHITAFPWIQFSLILGLLAGSLIAIRRFSNRTEIYFFAALFWLSFVPSQFGVPLFLSMDPIRLYMPLAALSVFAAASLVWLGSRSGISMFARRPPILIGAVAIFYTLFSFLQNQTYRRADLAWRDVTDAYPSSDVAWAQLGSVLQEQGRHAEAASALHKAAQLDPLYRGRLVRALYNDLHSGVDAKRMRAQVLALTKEPLQDSDQIMLATLAEAIGAFDVAEKLLLDLIARNQVHAPAHFQLGRLWERQERHEDARKAFSNAKQLTHN